MATSQQLSSSAALSKEDITHAVHAVVMQDLMI